VNFIDKIKEREFQLVIAKAIVAVLAIFGVGAEIEPTAAYLGTVVTIIVYIYSRTVIKRQESQDSAYRAAFGPVVASTNEPQVVVVKGGA
jgi:hypothetical protein